MRADRVGRAGGDGRPTRAAEPVVAAGREPAAPVRVYRRRGLDVRVALVTGLLAFLVAAAVLTIPEIVAGEAVGGKGRTTLFSGGDDRERDRGGDRGGDRDAKDGDPSRDGGDPDRQPADQKEPPAGDSSGERRSTPQRTAPAPGGGSPKPAPGDGAPTSPPSVPSPP